MEIIYKKINEIIPYEKNPRHNDEAVKYVAESIKEFGFKVPIIIDKNNIIVTGHTRLKAAKKLGLKEVPTIMADDLTEEQIKAFRLADNKVSEFSSWDLDMLSDELADLDIDMEQFGFTTAEDFVEIATQENNENPYTAKINIPQYEIKGEEPDIIELYNDNKTNALIEEIENANITDEQKEFLKKAATRHIEFSYNKIAEYYAHQDKTMQELMEKSALVIIDYDDAIKNGYAELIDGISSISQNIDEDEDREED